MSARTTKGKSHPVSVPVRVPEQEVDEVVEDLDEALEVIPFTYSITAYGADYPVDSVVKRIESSDIIVPTFSWAPTPDSDVVGFQREYVWPRPKADRFIESLLLGQLVSASRRRRIVNMTRFMKAHSSPPLGLVGVPS